MIAIPREPPTWRMLFSTAEPTPALSRGTEPIAAAVTGAIAAAMPIPPRSIAGSRSQKVASVPNREKRKSDDGEDEHPARDEPARADRGRTGAPPAARAG